MRIGFIGAGRMAQALGRLFVAAGHEVVLSNRSGADTLVPVLAKLGPLASALPAVEIIAASDIVILAVRWHDVVQAGAELAPLLLGKVLVDTTNNHVNGVTHDIGGRLSSAIVAQAFPGAVLVKAFNHQLISLLDELAARPFAEPRALFVAGDDDGANALVAGLIRDIGCEPILTGDLISGSAFQGFGGPAGGRPALLGASEGRALFNAFTAGAAASRRASA